VGGGGPRSRFGSDVEQAPLAALVGREREVDVLRDTLTGAREEREPALVTLVGVPRIGARAGSWPSFCRSWRRSQS
jgi:hypothetical protein